MKKFLAVVATLVLILLLYAHFVLPGQVERSQNVNLPHAPYAVSAEAQALHDSLFIADLHTDSLLWKREPAREVERRAHGPAQAA